MKMYCGTESLRLVGKVWEVREKLRQLCAQNISLEEWLRRRTAARDPYRLPIAREGHPSHIHRT